MELIVKSLISSVKLQDTRSVHKNQLRFYTLTMNYQKEKLKKKIFVERYNTDLTDKIHGYFIKI